MLGSRRLNIPSTKQVVFPEPYVLVQLSFPTRSQNHRQTNGLNLTRPVKLHLHILTL
ncbi:hypothetical protein LguiB_015884 [Lonicera macranthoides]